MSSTHCSAICRTSSRVRIPNGCGITAIGRSGLPSARACARPSVRNAVEQIATAARPAFAASTLSWTLHDEQDPQSPEPVITRSHWLATSRSISSGAGTDAERLRRFTTARTP